MVEWFVVLHVCFVLFRCFGWKLDNLKLAQTINLQISSDHIPETISSFKEILIGGQSSSVVYIETHTYRVIYANHMQAFTSITRLILLY